MQTDWLTDRGGSETIAPQAENTAVETPRELWGREHTHQAGNQGVGRPACVGSCVCVSRLDSMF